MNKRATLILGVGETQAFTKIHGAFPAEKQIQYSGWLAGWLAAYSFRLFAT